tara:strand:+ start:282 stop:422 length:141 start_codon:yes stop_codon:yes gene_type:complete
MGKIGRKRNVIRQSKHAWIQDALMAIIDQQKDQKVAAALWESFAVS